MMTMGEVFRALLPYYGTTHAMDVAVNDARRTYGFKNYYAAAVALLSQFQGATTYPLRGGVPSRGGK